ncbi:hypothetical protein AVEN_275700-1 [Araneus ventricosus]|uniref:Uncharacterized protein n=1 Tax=Araneus ventricosus TaxID=182803 RepID=A0A4Y2P5I8_ARAVE|nr:hypothetical protein AVEN_275700-1 [Araneus ventricosus]
MIFLLLLTKKASPRPINQIHPPDGKNESVPWKLNKMHSFLRSEKDSAPVVSPVLLLSGAWAHPSISDRGVGPCMIDERAEKELSEIWDVAWNWFHEPIP